MAADLKLVEGGAMERESDPLLDPVLGLMANEVDDDYRFAERTFEQRQGAILAAERGLKKGRGVYRRRAIYGGLAVAAAALMGLVVGTDLLDQGPGSAAAFASQSGQIEYRSAGGGWGSLPESGEIEWGAGLRTAADASAKIETPWGATVGVNASTRMAFPTAPEAGTDGARVVHLMAGAIDLDVPPLGPSETFAVHASGHQVVVHGTQFTVSVQEEGAAPCVQVARGVVEVKGPKHNAWLRAGEDVGCQLPVEEMQMVVAETEQQAAPSQKKAAHVARQFTKRSGKKPVPSSTLAEQNRIFQRALSAERAGHVSAALGHLDRLLSKYPDSPLAGQAKAQRRQLLSHGSQK